MESQSNNFGARLRGMIERKGVTIARFSSDLGIGESQAFNWLKAQKPPPSKHWGRLCNYFGVSESYLLTGTFPLESGALAHEEPASYLAEPVGAEAEIEQHHAALLLAARRDPVRLGWIREQQRAHLAIPAHWAEAEPSVPELSPIAKVADDLQRRLAATMKRAGHDPAAHAYAPGKK